MVEYIRGIIALIKERFSYEAVFRVLKTGFADLNVIKSMFLRIIFLLWYKWF